MKKVIKLTETDENLTGFYIDYINIKNNWDWVGYDIRPSITNYNIDKTNFKNASTGTVCSLYNDSNSPLSNGGGNYNVRLEKGKSRNFITIGSSGDASRSIEKYPHEMKYTVKCKQWGKNGNNKNFDNGWSNVDDYDQIFEISFQWKYPEEYTRN